MVNMLIADDDLNFSKNMINEILKNSNIRVCKIATDGQETLNILEEEKIDVIILDMIMPIYNGLDVLNRLSDSQKQKYKNSIIVMSGDDRFISQLIDNPLIYDYIEKGITKERLLSRINRLIECKDITTKKKVIINELEHIGYDIHHKGTIYLADAILQIYINDETMIDNLQRDIYPLISKVYNKTINNIKCNINNATESMYYRCESKILREYFKFHDDTKPTAKTVIYTILNKIR